MKKILLTAALLLLASLSASAYDFMYNGLCYNITGDNTVSLTWELFPDMNPSAYSNLGGSVTIPETVYHSNKAYTVTAIGPASFCKCAVITGVSIPKTVKTIGASALTYCTSLSSVTFAEGSELTEIQNFAFDYDTCLVSITLPNTVSTVGDGIFSGCRKLQSINIPTSLTYIGWSMFSSCKSLKSFDIPNWVTEIKTYAFHYCEGLEKVSIPNSVRVIGARAFKDCTGLTSITIPNSVDSIAHDAFNQCKGLKSVTIPSSVRTIGNYAFSSCDALETLNIDSNVAADIKYYTKSALKTLTLGNSVTVIPENAFKDCPALESVTLPNNFSSIGNSAFAGCTLLGDVTSLREKPIGIDASVFSGVQVNGYCDLHVPKGSVGRYRAMDVWKDFYVIDEGAGQGSGTGLQGDVNADGKVNVSDVSALINIILGIH